MVAKAARYRHLYGRRKDGLLATLLPVAIAFDHAQESGVLTPEQIHLIADAARHPQLLVAMNASELLAVMSDRWPAAVLEAIEELFQSPKAHARFAAICSLTEQIRGDALTELLRMGFRDKSGRVRWKAANRAERLECRDLLPDLAAATRAGRNAKRRGQLEFHPKMLRDGYVVDSESKGCVDVWIRTSSGYAGRRLSLAAVELKGLEGAARDLAGSFQEAE